LLFATVAAAAASVGPAGSALADKAAEATFYFELGMAHGKRGKLRQAVEAFFQSNRLAPNPTVTFNIAAGLEELRRYDQAFTYYGEVLAMTADEETRQDARAGLDRVLPKVARLQVNSEPPGATIYLDRENLGELGRTPRLFAARPGKRTVILELAGHHPARAEVVLEEGEQAEVRLRLRRVVGVVAVKSEPEGAAIRVGDEAAVPLAVTPAEVSLPTGDVELYLTLEGHQPAQATVTVEAERPAEVSLALEPLPPPTGRVTVTGSHAGALVELDGRQAGFTPIVLEDVAVGAHELKVSMAAQRPWTGAIEVREETPLWATVTLMPEEQETGRGPWPWALAATSGVALLGGAVFAALALSKQAEYEEAPTHGLADDGERLTLTADLMFVTAALVGVAAGAMFAFTEPLVERESTAHVTGGTPAPGE